MAASKLTNEEKLKRLIYIGNVDPKYYCGGPETYVKVSKAKVDLLEEILKTNYMDLLKVVEAINDDRLVPYRSHIFNVLAYAMKMDSANPQNKHAISTTVLKLIKNDKEFFDFVQHASRFNKHKLPKTVRKAITAFYKKKSPLELAQLYADTRSVHGWSHKDLIKLCHLKSETPLHNVVINYILKNKTNEKETGEEKKIIEIVQKSDMLRKTIDHKVAVPLIQELKATIDHVEPTLRKSAEVWSTALPNMSLVEILRSLPKLYKLGFLKKESPTQARVTEALTNVEKIKRSGIHPIEVFIYMKNFEKGGKPLDPKLLQHLAVEKKLTEEELLRLRTPTEAKCPTVLSNLQKCMNISNSNVQSLGKRYLITIDTTDKMDTRVLCNKNITGIEAAAAFVWYLLRSEKDVTVAVFKDKEVAVVSLDKKAHLYDHVQKLREHKSKYLVLASPMEWATSNKKHFDIFLNFIHHKEYYATVPKEVREKMAKPVEVLQKYRKKVNLPNAKLVNFCLSSPLMEVADGSPNILDVSGLDFGVPKVVEAFCRGSFC